MRNDKHKKYEYFINKLAKKNLLEGLAEQDNSEVKSTAGEAYFDLIDMTSPTDKNKYLATFQKNNPREFNNLLNFILADANDPSGSIDKNGAIDLLTNYYTQSGGNPKLKNMIRNSNIIKHLNVSDGEIASALGEFITDVVNKGGEMENFEAYVSKSTPRIVRSISDAGKSSAEKNTSHISKDAMLGTDSTGRVEDKLSSDDVVDSGRNMEYIASNVDFDGKDVFFNDIEVGKINHKKGSYPEFVVNDDLAPEMKSVITQKVISNAIADIYAELKLKDNNGDINAWEEELFSDKSSEELKDLDASEEDYPKSHLFDTQEEMVNFYDTLQGIQKNAINYLRTLKGGNTPGMDNYYDANWFEDVLVDNIPPNELLASPSAWKRYGINNVLRRYMYMALPSYIKNELQMFVPGLISDPKNANDFKINSAIMSDIMMKKELPALFDENGNISKGAEKLMQKYNINQEEYVRLLELSAPNSQLRKHLINLRNDFKNLDPTAFEDVTKHANPTLQELGKYITQVLNGDKVTSSIPDGNNGEENEAIDSAMGKIFLDDIANDLKGSNYNKLFQTEFRKNPNQKSNYEDKPIGWTPGAVAWVQNNMDKINSKVDDNMLVKMLATTSGGLNEMPDYFFDKDGNALKLADHLDPKGAYDFQRANFITNYKRGDAGTGSARDFYINDDAFFEKNIKPIWNQLDAEGQKEAKELYLDAIAAKKDISSVGNQPPVVRSRDGYKKAERPDTEREYSKKIYDKVRGDEIDKLNKVKQSYRDAGATIKEVKSVIEQNKKLLGDIRKDV